MSSVRTSVKWLFGLLSNYLKFVDFKKMQRFGMSPVRKIYIVCSILQNAHTSLYGNLISEKIEPQYETIFNETLFLSCKE